MRNCCKFPCFSKSQVVERLARWISAAREGEGGGGSKDLGRP